MTLFEQENKYLMNTYTPLPIEITYGQGSYLFDKNNCWIEKIDNISNNCIVKESITDNITVKMSQEGVCPAGVRFTKNINKRLLPAGTEQPIKASYIDNGDNSLYMKDFRDFLNRN